MNKPTICVVGTGGTIASKFDASIGGHVASASASNLIEAIREIGDVVEIRAVEHSNVNSARMDLRTSFRIARYAAARPAR